MFVLSNPAADNNGLCARLWNRTSIVRLEIVTSAEASMK
jgi:hypothetical protein